MTFAPEDLVWEDPPDNPTGVRGKSRIDLVIAELRLHPGKWAIVATYDANTSATGVADKFKRSGCESTTRGGDIYARWPESVA